MIVVVLAFTKMNNLSVARSDLPGQLAALRRPNTWIASALYVGTFGSFIGYSSAFPLLIKTQFPDIVVGHYAFLGALVGSLARPLGGWLADRYGGARITASAFVVMGMGALGVMAALRYGGFAEYLAAFCVLFVACGAGNGSVYRMIPAVFRATSATPAVAAREGGAALGIAAAVGAFGGFFVPRAFGSSLAHTGGVDAALIGFVGVYMLGLAITWICYLRRRTTLAASAAGI